MKARNVKRKKAEKKLEEQLNTILPKRYTFVGNGEFVLRKRCPDFLNSKKKKLIELYGNYWHRNDNPQDKIDYFRRYGYDTLVIWEDELKNVDVMNEKILAFEACEIK